MSVTRTLQTPGGTFNPSPLLNDNSNRDTTSGYTYVVPANFPFLYSNLTANIFFDALTCIDRIEFTFTSSITLISEFWTQLDQEVSISGPGVSVFNVAGSVQIFPTNLQTAFTIRNGGADAVLIATFDPVPIGVAHAILGIATTNDPLTATVTDFRVYRLGYEVTASGGDCSSPGEGNDPSGNPNPAGGDGTGDGWGRPGSMNCAWGQNGTLGCSWTNPGTPSCGWGRGQGC